MGFVLKHFLVDPYSTCFQTPTEFPTQHSATPEWHWEDLEYIFPHLACMLPCFVDWIDNTLVMGYFPCPDVKHPLPFPHVTIQSAFIAPRLLPVFLNHPIKTLVFNNCCAFQSGNFWKRIGREQQSKCRFRSKKQNSYSSLLNSGTVQWTLKHNLFPFKNIFQTNKQTT